MSDPDVPTSTGRSRKMEVRAAAALTFILTVAISRNTSSTLLGQYTDVAAGAAAATAIVIAARWWAQHPHARIGLTNWTSGAAHGGVFAALTGGILALALAAPAGRALLLENAPDAYPQSMWITAALLIVPLGTVAFEELFFRGVLWSYLTARVSVNATWILTSALFAAWHLPGVLIDPDAAAGPNGSIAVVIAGTLAVTFTGGLVFGWLRKRSGSVLAPIIAHIATNSLGYLAAAGAASLS